jgi:hypothetical protein
MDRSDWLTGEESCGRYLSQIGIIGDCFGPLACPR